MEHQALQPETPRFQPGIFAEKSAQLKKIVGPVRMNGVVSDFIFTEMMPKKQTLAEALAGFGITDIWKLHEFNDQKWRITFSCKGEGKIVKAKLTSFDETSITVETIIGTSLTIPMDHLYRTSAGTFDISRTKDVPTDKERYAARVADQNARMKDNELSKEEREAIKNGDLIIMG